MARMNDFLDIFCYLSLKFQQFLFDWKAAAYFVRRGARKAENCLHISFFFLDFLIESPAVAVFLCSA